MGEDSLHYDQPEWFESLQWQRRWIGYMVGWYCGHYGVPGTVIDFGCGDGWWAKCFHDLGSAVGGIELHEIAKEYIPQQVQVLIADLSQPLNLGNVYHLTICLEVAEHLSLKGADNLCFTLNRHTHDTLLFSAAQPGQDGTGHVNCQPPSYWRKKLANRGLEFSSMKTAEVKRAFENITNDLFDFLPRNVQVFCRVRK
jgi:hypothetical protein